MRFIKIILILLFSYQGEVFSQEPYFTLANNNFPVSSTTINSMDVESADVDGDGDIDLVIAAEYARNLLFFNDGGGNFSEDPTRLFPEKNLGDPFPGEDSEDIAFADFNNDGKIDVLFVSEDTNFHELLINDGSGRFSFIAYEFPASAGNAVAVLDLNNDTFPDIIIGNTGQNHIYINNQDLTFTQENNRWPVNTEGTQDLKLIDLDNDGDMDIIEGIDLGSNNALINTNGFFSEENNRLPNTGLLLETRKVTLGDVNNDTFPDIFVSTVNFIGSANLQNRLYLNDGSGVFTDATSTNLPNYAQNTLDALFYDYDIDGDVDLITTDFQNPAGNYHAFENNGSGLFSEATSTVFEPFSFTGGVGLHTADLNGDSYKDLYFSNFQETDDLLFFSENGLGVQDINLNDSIAVYPNPSVNLMYIINPKRIDLDGIKIYDMSGRLVQTISFFEDIGSKIVLDISKLASASYILVMKSEYGILTERFIKR